MGKRNIERAFKQALARAALPDAIRIHDLRHGSATQRLSAGVNPKLVRAFSAVRKIRAVDNFFMALYAKYESCCT